MLIFMIFVMLAAERKPEMGMARAVGAQRGNLVQSFMSEGMAYSVIAGAVGAAFGVLRRSRSSSASCRSGSAAAASFITAHVTLRSLVVSYCLGVVVTFITVVISSMKVSARQHRRAPSAAPTTTTAARAARKTNWKWARHWRPGDDRPAARHLVPLPQGLRPRLGVDHRAGRHRSRRLALLGASGGGGGSEFLAGFGFSLIPLCVAQLASYYRAPGRADVDAGRRLPAGATGCSPVEHRAKLLGTSSTGDIEMFLMSGIMVVIGFTLIIVFNARLLTTLFRTGGASKLPRRDDRGGGRRSRSSLTGVVLGNKGDGLGQLLYLFAGVGAIVAAAVVRGRALPAARAGPEDGRRLSAVEPLPHRHDDRDVLADHLLAHRLQHHQRELHGQDGRQGRRRRLERRRDGEPQQPDRRPDRPPCPAPARPVADADRRPPAA